jgi:hypothetical protein
MTQITCPSLTASSPMAPLLAVGRQRALKWRMFRTRGEGSSEFLVIAEAGPPHECIALAQLSKEWLRAALGSFAGWWARCDRIPELHSLGTLKPC